LLLLKQFKKIFRFLKFGRIKSFLPSWLAEKYKKDLIVVRKRDYKIKDQIKIKQKKAYGQGNLFCLGLKKKDKVLIMKILFLLVEHC